MSDTSRVTQIDIKSYLVPVDGEAWAGMIRLRHDISITRNNGFEERYEDVSWASHHRLMVILVDAANKQSECELEWLPYPNID